MIPNSHHLVSYTRLRKFLYVLIIVTLAACSRGTPTQIQSVSQTPAPAATHAMAAPVSVPLTGQGFKVQVEINDHALSQTEIFVPAGAVVVWTNKGQNSHTLVADDNSFSSGSLKNGETFEHTFNQAGTFIYHYEPSGQAGGKVTGSITVYEAPAQSANMVMPVPQPAVSENQPVDPAAAKPVTAGNQPAGQAGAKRVFYIAAVEVEWDYVPTNINQITGKPFGDQENVFVENGETRIGKVYTKAVYREFTDNTFSTQKPVAPKWKHLGIMGPVIHAEVGDQIVIHFKNLTQIPTSMHPHGVFYNKDSEGAGYNDGTSGNNKTDDSVPPGGTHTYVWDVPDRAGPGPMDPSSIMWMYHSHVDEPGDTNAGLMGAIIVSARGKANVDGTPKDVDREFVVTFSVLDENVSPYLQHNIETKTGTPGKVDQGDDEFHESNLMHSINGYVYGNLPGLVMKKGERVRWYVMGMGTEVDLHTPHWHGNVITMNGMRMDVIMLMPASMVVADMVPDNPGVWLFHCHVNDHILAGMQALYTVEQ